jgi:thiamine kinase-like enzyme
VRSLPTTDDPIDAIRALPIWRGPIAVTPLDGGITNRNYRVEDGGRRFVVRVGHDILVHGILRFNEVVASRAAAAAGISPAVAHSAPGFLVIDFIEGHCFRPEDVRATRDRCVALVKRAHREVARHLRGPVLSFNVFHVLRDYAHTLVADRSRIVANLPRLGAIAEALEAATGPIDLVLGHNDLLAANIIDDGARLWLIDWEFAGFTTPLFDLGGLSSNNGFSDVEDEAMLESYFERAATDELRRRFCAVRCASLLREALWSMVSEIHSDLEFDYVSYTAENMKRFETAWAAFRELQH